MMPTPDWYSPAFLSALERLSMRVRQGSTTSVGERQSTGRGGRADFIGHRPYAPGDDLRQLDWNVYSRHDSLHVKVYAAERRYNLTIVVDGSKSMAAGEIAGPSKYETAQQLAAAFAFLALRAGVHVRVGIASTDKRVAWSDDLAGLAKFNSVLAHLAQHPAATGDATHTLADQLATESLSLIGRGGLLVLSDGYEQDDLLAALRRLGRNVKERTFLQILSRDELQPTLTGQLRLRDVEADGALATRRQVGAQAIQSRQGAGAPWVDVAATATALTTYAEVLDEFLSRWQRLCLTEGVRYGLIKADQDIFAYLSGEARRQGLLA